MKQLALGAVVAVVFTGGMFAGLVERDVVSELTETEAIQTAEAADDLDGLGVCKGFGVASCFPPNCSDGKCPSNNQCTGQLICSINSISAGGNGGTITTCTTSGTCDSSKYGDPIMGSADKNMVPIPNDSMAPEEPLSSPIRGFANQDTRYYY